MERETANSRGKCLTTELPDPDYDSTAYNKDTIFICARHAYLDYIVVKHVRFAGSKTINLRETPHPLINMHEHDLGGY